MKTKRIMFYIWDWTHAWNQVQTGELDPSTAEGYLLARLERLPEDEQTLLKYLTENIALCVYCHEQYQLVEFDLEGKLYISAVCSDYCGEKLLEESEVIEVV